MGMILVIVMILEMLGIRIPGLVLIAMLEID